MRYSKRYYIFILLVIVCGFFPAHSFSSQVFFHQRSSDKLNERWDWAIREAEKQGFKDGFWIGYGIKRLMGEYSYICSTGQYSFQGSYPFPFSLKGKTLGEILYGKDFSIILSDEDQVQQAAKRALAEMEKSGKSQRKVWKDVAVLFKFASDSSKIPETIRLNNLTMPFDTENLPLLWLDKAGEEQSIFFLSSLYKGSTPEQLKKKILSTIGFHGNSELVVPFLEKVLKGGESDTLRGRAASELGDQESERAAKILHQAVKNDRSHYVRKKAVYGLEDIHLPPATDALIEIARNSDDRDIRKRAISCLADKATQKAAAALEDFVYEDDDTEVQKRAVYALEDLPDREGIPFLIKIAKTHPKLVIRKSAIYCLGDSDDPRALKTLIEILQKK